MYKIISFVLLFISNVCFGQQESKVRIDSGNGNEITVLQQGQNTQTKSDINISHGKQNIVRSSQTVVDSSFKKKEPFRFLDIITNYNAITVLLTSFVTLTTVILGLRKFLKKK